MDRREFLVATVVGATAGAADTSPTTSGPPAHSPSDPIEELSLADIAAAFADGRLTSQQLTKGYLARIDRLDRHGPNLRAVIETNPRALDIAADICVYTNRNVTIETLQGG